MMFLVINFVHHMAPSLIDQISLPYELRLKRSGALTRTNRALFDLSRLTRAQQIALQEEYVDRCTRHNSKGPPYTDNTEWDYGRLDVIAIALGKRPILYDPETLGFIAKSLAPRAAIRLVPFKPRFPTLGSDENFFFPVTGTSAETPLRKQIRSGYYVIRPARRI